MAHYYILDSDGEDTNLQLYALRQAKIYWRELESEYAECEEATEYLVERCVFVLASMGLSISQLLGQNNPSLTDRVPSPVQLFESIVQKHGLDPDLVRHFRRFVYYYDGCRHFGKTETGGSHRKIDELTFDVARECYEFGLQVWRTILEVYGKEPNAELSLLDIDHIEDPIEY